MLDDLYYGRISPWERRNRRAAEQLETVRKIDVETDYFENKLSDEDRHRFRSLSKMLTDLATDDEEDSFRCGFSLGALMMIDVIRENDRRPK